jgi:DNA mismatch endonuclease (patch repair protein)
MDNVSKEKRSEIMKKIRSKDTKPEMIVRKFLTSRKIRYRLHSKELPGCPDIVVRKKKMAIFINGCFWHGHGCKLSKIPMSNQEYWKRKIEANMERDLSSLEKIKDIGWFPIVLWECEVKNELILEERLRGVLDEASIESTP